MDEDSGGELGRGLREEKRIRHNLGMSANFERKSRDACSQQLNQRKVEPFPKGQTDALVGVTKTEPLRELVWESRKDPDHERQKIYNRAEDPHIARG